MTRARQRHATRPVDAFATRCGRRGALRAAVAAAALLVAARWDEAGAAVPNGLPALRRGLNLTHWFEYEQSQAVSPQEMQALRALGFDHVRIPVDPVVGGWTPERGGPLSYLPALRRAVEQAVAAGLEVVVDLHMTPETKQRIEDQPALEASLFALWTGLAGAFADLPVDRVAFELFNEPQYYGARAARWAALQQRLLAALRLRAPEHLVLLSGNEGGSLKALERLAPLADTRVAYVFHYYAPFLFTHQSTSWQDIRYTTAGLWRDVRYPADRLAGTRPRLLQPHPRATAELAEYEREGWGATRVRADLEVAGALARRRGLRVVCNEFGVIRANVDPASRYRWIADVRAGLEANDLGWTLWDYTDIFGVTAESARPGMTGARALEPEAIRALGLRGAGTGH